MKKKTVVKSIKRYILPKAEGKKDLNSNYAPEFVFWVIPRSHNTASFLRFCRRQKERKREVDFK